MPSDKRLEWTDDLNINDENIDNQHKQIFSILNKMNKALPEDSNNKEFARLLTALTEYGLTHLKDEEKLMSDNHYPGLEEHKRVHKAYLLKIANFNIKFYETSRQEVVDFLTNWWYNHITGMDMKYRDFIRSKEK